MVILMEDMSLAVAVPFRLGNSFCSSTTTGTRMNISRLKLMADTASLLADSTTKSSVDYTSDGNEDCNCDDFEMELSCTEVSMPEENRCGGAAMVDMISEKESDWVPSDALIQESEEDDSLLLEGDQILDGSCSLSVISDCSSVCGDDFLVYEASLEIGTPSSIDVEKSISNIEIIVKPIESRESNFQETVNNPLAVAVGHEEGIGDESNSKPAAVVIQLPPEKGSSGTAVRSVFEVDYAPLWGITSMCGRRPEMEDALATLPRFMKLPIQMLIGDRVPDGVTKVTKCLSHLTAHLFGVCDGHGGSQVANYCRDRLHSALAEELELFMAGLSDGSSGDSCQEQWKKAFTNTFLKVDTEIGGESTVVPVAPETVGSTAVVTIVCSSHIIVANCGDSRAVLCRGKEPLALSVDRS